MKNKQSGELHQNVKHLLAMKLSIVFILVGSLQLSASVLLGQQVGIQVKNAPLAEVLEQLNKQTGIYFMYNEKDIDADMKLNLNVKFADLKEVLDEICLQLPITYEMIEDFVVITKQNLKQSKKKKKIEGKVSDTDGVALPGVSVLVKGTSVGTATNSDGNYSLELDQKEAILVFSFIGMKTREIVFQGQAVQNIIMQFDTEQVEEVIVTGYQKIDRRLFTGAATKVNMDDVKLSSESDISKSLEGQVAGVSVQNVSSTFGTAPKIRVRGASSIYGNQKPLWVIDGIVLEDAVEVSMDDLNSGNLATIISSGVAGLNMDDIESFQILKDVSATALYGARAMNGVIVITTKKGRSGKLNINYSMGLTLKPRPSYKDYNIMNSKDQMSVNRELYEKGWTNISRTQFDKNHGPYGKLFDKIANNQIDWANNNDEVNDFLRKYETANTNWFDELFRTSLQQQHTLSISGGSEKATFYTSVGYLTDNGWTIADQVDRYTALLKGTYHINDKLSVAASSNMSFRDQSLSGSSNTKSDANLKVDRFTGKINRDFDNNPFLYALTTSRCIRPYDDEGNLEYFRRNYTDFNIIDELGKNTIGAKVRDMTFTADFNYKANPDLIFNTRISSRYYHAETTRRIHENSNQANALRAGMGANDSEILRDANPFLFELPGSTTGIKYSTLPEGGIYEMRNHSMANYYFNGSVNWNPKIGEDHLFTFLGGAEVRHIKRNYDWNQGYGHFFDMGNSSKPSPYYLQKLAMDGLSYFGTEESNQRFVAFYLNYGYSFKGKYTLNGTVRYDGSNRLGKSTTARWMPTWNISGKWNLKAEDFLQDEDWLNLLNLRATYGLNGSLGNATNASLIAYSGSTSRPFHPEESEVKISISQLENSDLSWEKQHEFNMGIDFTIFEHKISGELNYYRRKAFDLIGIHVGNGVGGNIMKWGNVADMKSNGFEMMLDFTPVELTDFTWGINLNYSYNTSEITSLLSTRWIAEATSVYGVPVLGGPVRGIYSSRFAGLDHRGIPTFYNRNDQKEYYLNTQTEDYSDFAYSGNLEPETNLGITNRFSYKGLSLSFLITGQFGHKKRVMQQFSYSYKDNVALSEHLKNRWRISGDEQKTNIPAILDADVMNREDDSQIKAAYNLYGMSDYWIADASFIRLKNTSLSYQVPKTVAKKAGVTRANISIQASNLVLLWLADKDKLNGEDPEFVWTGGTTMPISKQFTFTLNIGF